MEIRIILCGVLLAFAMFAFLVFINLLRRNERITKSLAIFSLCITFYSFGYAMELYSNSLSQMLFWNLVQYIGLPFLPVFWIIFTLEYNNKHIRFRTKLSLFLIPILTLILRYTSDANHLFYLSVQFTTNQYFPVLYIEKGPWYWVNAIFATTCIFISNYSYFDKYRKSVGSIRHQSLLMLIASILPWVSLILDLLNLAPFNIDYAPFALTFSLIFLLLAFLRYQFLNIRPLARDMVFESTSDGIIVLDNNYHIIDFNRSAASICSALKDNVIGKDVRRVLGEYEGLINSILNYVESQCDLEEPKGNYKVNTVKISEQNNGEVGYIVTLTDITKYMDMMGELNHLASRDSLTGVFNRRQFLELSTYELEKPKCNQHPHSLIILDLDFFKQINDSFGHLAGDAVLQEVADICRNSIRSTDILGRYGGEEFVIFLPETTLEECRIISDRILTNIAKAEVHYEEKCIKTTASLGITWINPAADVSIDYLLKIADKALYRAKLDGRNCIRSIMANC